MLPLPLPNPGSRRLLHLPGLPQAPEGPPRGHEHPRRQGHHRGLRHPPGDRPALGHPSSFNDWWFDDNGGTFNRSAYIDLFEDLSLALGNPAYEQAAAPFFPPGVDDSLDLPQPGGDQEAQITAAPSRSTTPSTTPTNASTRSPSVTARSPSPSGRRPAARGLLLRPDPGRLLRRRRPCDRPLEEHPQGQVSRRILLGEGHLQSLQPHHQRIRIALAVDCDGDGKRD